MTDMLDLATVTRTDFEAMRQEPILLVAANGTVDLSIEEVRQMGSGAGLRAGGAFSVVFRGPATPFVEQAIHRLEVGLPDSGRQAALDLFLVPVGHDAQGRLYEAVFT
ncbi:hypothetical protein [Stappia sp. P2PMeth1]|uniref:DUF6916 family protein n=1 Tax=Stappia sp. P2PMeth1 TaxID=2003586 RepID=UPI00164976A0|nr:hypothetical protein [Stappia sp. P2PMeth1]